MWTTGVQGFDTLPYFTKGGGQTGGRRLAGGGSCWLGAIRGGRRREGGGSESCCDWHHGKQLMEEMKTTRKAENRPGRIPKQGETKQRNRKLTWKDSNFQRFVLKVCNDFKDNATPIGQQVLAYSVLYFFLLSQVHVCAQHKRLVYRWDSNSNYKWKAPSCSENSWICFGHSLALVQSSQSMQKIAVPLMASYLHCTDSWALNWLSQKHVFVEMVSVVSWGSYDPLCRKMMHT